MIWSPQTLKCQIYDDNKLVDLNQCHDDVLEELADLCLSYWKTPHNSAVWFDVEIYEKHYWSIPPKNFIEICAFKFDLNKHDKRRQVSVSKLYIDKMVGKRFKITPKSGLIRKWSDNVEVAFVV